VGSFEAARDPQLSKLAFTEREKTSSFTQRTQRIRNGRYVKYFHLIGSNKNLAFTERGMTGLANLFGHFRLLSR
jgi:hypothetical protein